jgi:hypothetical protein
VLSDLANRHGYSRVCDSIEDCGGPMRSTINFAVYIFIVDAGAANSGGQGGRVDPLPRRFLRIPARSPLGLHAM